MIRAFLDANIPLYAAGGDHPLKQPSAEILLLVAARPEAFVTSAEVIQEMIHRYLSLRGWPLHGPIVREFLDLMNNHVEPVTVGDVAAAVGLADRYSNLQSRNLVHAAVMHRLGIKHIVSADRGFDQILEFRRLDPANVETWKSDILL